MNLRGRSDQDVRKKLRLWCNSYIDYVGGDFEDELRKKMQQS